MGETKAEAVNHSGIIPALHAAYKECGYIQKKSKTTQYTFAGEAQFIEELRPILIRNGIIVYQSGCRVACADGYESTSKAGSTSHVNRVVAELEFTFAHLSGESIKVTAIGEGTDTNGDKSAYKANTGGLKYALRQTLLIETGNDPDEKPNEDYDQSIKRITETQRQALIDALGGPGERVKAFCAHNGLITIEELGADSFDTAMAQIKAANAKRAA